MSAMSDMSRAIRLELEAKSTDGTMSGLPTDVLDDYCLIVSAYLADLRDERARRTA